MESDKDGRNDNDKNNARSSNAVEQEKDQNV